ncbi:hypothetical protein [Serratia sp. MYb239]|uniref:hypothetical protein n=1 Tax=Serratia sp. MYb239 TaxID=2033438 RepID=UPI00131A3F37|nr:hypothetical protein [Serratia sp. MYb239]
MLNTKRPIAERRALALNRLVRSVQSEQDQPSNNPVIEASGPPSGTTAADNPVLHRHVYADSPSD